MKSEVSKKFNGVKDVSKFNMAEVDTYDEGEKDFYDHQDENLPLSVRERR